MENFNLFDEKIHTIIGGEIKSVLLEESQKDDEQPKLQESSESDPNLWLQENISTSLACSYCQVKFDDVLQQREHYKLDWHRYNLRLSLLNKLPITESEFCNRNEQDDLSSISASSSDLEQNDGPDMYSTAQGKIFLQNTTGVVFSVYACLLYDKKDELQNVDVAAALNRCRTKKWTILLLGGGHFAGAVFDGDTAILHKTFHCYTVRAGQGGSQSSRDNKSGGSHPKSAGASLRRYNEQALVQHVRGIIEAWKNEIAQSSLIIYRASGPYNRSVLFGGQTPLLNKEDRRLRTIPFSTRRATFREIERIFAVVTTVQVFKSLESAANHFARSKQPEQKQKRKKPEETNQKEPKTIEKPIVLPSSSAESSEGEFELTCEDQEISFKDLQEFDDTLTQQKKVHRKKKPKKSKAKKLKEKVDQLKNDLIKSVTDGSLERLEELLEKSLTILENQEKLDTINMILDDAGNSLLHVAVAQEQVNIVEFLLNNNADPCARNKKQQTPYVSTTSKNVREFLREFARDNPDKFNYNKAQIPINLPTAEEQAERKKAQRKIKKEKEKVKKKENEVKRQEDTEKERFLRLSDREKRALAAERRLVNQSGAVILRCFECAADISTKVPFEYLGNKFCTVDCVKIHRVKYPPALS